MEVSGGVNRARYLGMGSAADALFDGLLKLISKPLLLEKAFCGICTNGGFQVKKLLVEVKIR